MRFNSIGALATSLTAKIALAEADKRRLLEGIGEMVEHTAKDLVGQEDVQGMNGFATHEPLADATVEWKQDHGYTGRVSSTDPNLRVGDMRDSYTHIVQPEEDSVIVGSNDKAAVYVELGTDKQPPRSILGIAAEMNREKVQKLGVEVAITMFKKP